MPLISVFGNSKTSKDSRIYQEAIMLGSLLGKKGFDIATGGYLGVMEAVMEGASQYNVRRIGVVTKQLIGRNVNIYLTEIIEKNSYLDRLSELVSIADGYVVFPGETGTLLELLSVITLKEKRIDTEKPLICIDSYWDILLKNLKNNLENKFWASEYIITIDTAERTAEYLFNYFK